MNKKRQIHRILEFICWKSNNNNIVVFSIREIAGSFEGRRKIADVNALCRIMIDNGDLIDVTTNEQSLKDSMSVSINAKTHEAFLSGKYLKWTRGEISLGIFILLIVAGIVTGIITGIINVSDIVKLIDIVFHFIR